MKLTIVKSFFSPEPLRWIKLIINANKDDKVAQSDVPYSKSLKQFEKLFYFVGK